MKICLGTLSAASIVNMFTTLTETWHVKVPQFQAISNSIEILLKSLHLCNFTLWHEEDQARRTDVEDSVIANHKRTIDKINQKRNDTIELIDRWILDQIHSLEILTSKDAELNSETPGNIIDRLSILCLKIYHMNEQIKRTGVSQEHVTRAMDKAKILKNQSDDLIECLDKLHSDLIHGRKRLKVYYQFKLYNDPSTNPALYQNVKKHNS